MKGGRFAAGALAGIAMFGAWQLLSRLSPDAIGMIVGLLFGVLAGVPFTLLMLYSIRQDLHQPVSRETPPRIIYVERPAQLAQPEQGEYVDVAPVRSRRQIIAK